MRNRRSLPLIVLAAGTSALLLGGCAPGGSGPSDNTTLGPVSKDVAAAGDVTLTVWDINGEGVGNDVQEALNASFMAEYPNVTVERVARAFSDSKTTIGLALNSDDAPDVAQVNQTYGDMGTFVAANLLRPLDDYAALYDWTSTFPEGQLAYNSYSADGKHWQEGSLYGLSQTGEIVGVYYNKDLLAKAGVEVPTTISEFDAALQKVAGAGILPIAFGNSEGWPALHEFGVIQADVLGSEAVRALVTGESTDWTQSGNVEAATLIQGWATNGYLTPDSGGVAPDAARSTFLDGGSAFYISGTWNAADVATGLGENAGFVVLSPDDSDTPSAPGGIGLAFGISSASKHPDVAAAYIDWITNASAAAQWLESGSLAAVVPDSYTAPAGVQADVITNWRAMNEANSLAPYLDYSSPTFYDVGSASLQELLAGRMTPEAFVDALQADADAFAAKR